jgi:hypothetical protein
MPGWVKVLLGLLAAGAVLIVVGIVGCAALVGGTANEIDKGIKEEQNSNAITNEQARAAKLGTTRGAVESRFGPPKSDQESTNEASRRHLHLLQPQGWGDSRPVAVLLRGRGEERQAEEQEPPLGPLATASPWD